MNSASCTVQATVISRVTVRTATTQEVSLSQPRNNRTALILSGEGVLQLNVDTSEPVETTIIELKQQAKEIKQNGFAKIKKMRLEYLSS